MSKKVLLIILDGWGEGQANFSNPIHVAKTPTFDFLRKNFPFFLLQASGISVGLPWTEVGNGEVGHLTIGTGRVYYQDYPRVTLAIKSGDFLKNKTLELVLDHAKKNQSRVHLVGLLTKDIINAAFDHIVALIDFFQKNNFDNFYLHLFLDGRDSPSQSGFELVEKIKKVLAEKGAGKIASLIGRSYAMDKNEDWGIRTERAFNLIVDGIGRKITDLNKYFEQIYSDYDFNDSNLEPILIEPDGIIQNNDSVFFFNFRADGIVQLASAFIDPKFNHFPRPDRTNLLIASMTKYFDQIDYPVAFPREKINIQISRIISEHGLKQIKLAEKVKTAHITYFFNGFYDTPHPNEFWKIFPAAEKNLDEQPLMQSEIIVRSVIELLNEDDYDFIAANLAAPDIIAHTGDFNLGVQVAEGTDRLITLIFEKILTKPNWTMLLTADHGNLEKMINTKTGKKDTGHNSAPVPTYIVSADLEKEKSTLEINRANKKIIGTLTDIAPTILSLMNLAIPDEMKGQNLLDLR
ncbi:MAG: 2,3-bisphosphoglycerate-independent phosphoglycerate mutase [Patescibacteria group bacterium]|nr:2,3-bisphosphoglycerate-independent phosphoglycerate mutase [Patescibacteria group bacterium]MCL5258111.1 2,3-bisphosphoglycerate-independent phosphoglycerate mutase [Patescibacteria group bacterium]